MHVPRDGKRVLVLARPAVDVRTNPQLRDVAEWRKPPRRGAPRSEQQVLATLTRHVVAAARAARQLDLARISAANSGAFADDLVDALRDLEQLRKRLKQRAGSSKSG